MKRVIAFISDLHIFSRFGLNLPEYISQYGIKFRIETPLRKIYDYWLDFQEICNREGVDTVVICGDIIHGQNPIERGTMLVSPSIDEQVDAAVKILNPLCQGRKVYVFKGSGYHGLKGASPEQWVCRQVGGKWIGEVGNLRFAPSKRVFNIQHGESSAYIYREMVLGREGLFMKYAQALGKIPQIDVIVRGHWHNFIYLHENQLHFIQLPGWLAFEPSRPYLRSYAKMQPDIGGVIVYIDDEDRIRVWHFLYPVINIVDRIRLA